MKLITLVFVLSFAPIFFVVTNAPQTLPYSQDWTDTNLITTADDWSGVPGIVGYLGDGLTGSTGTDPQTILVDGTNTTVDVLANVANPNSTSTGGVAEFDQLSNPTIALQGSGTADAPFILIHLNTTGFANINVAYLVRDLDLNDNAVQQVALHYRIGNSGNFTNLPDGYIADATQASSATLETPISVTLPADANNQPEVQVRVMTTNASGSDEWVGIDDINITGDPLGGPTCSISNISVGNISACNDNGTSDPNDDTFTADVTVTFANAPVTGTLDLTGDGTASVSVVGLASPHIFAGVTMSADGTAISLTSTFSDDVTCTLTNGSAGSAPAACSMASCDLVINEVDYDQPGSDVAEFIEIYNPCTGTINLTDYRVRLINGGDGSIYQTIDLPNVDLAAGDYFVICNDLNTTPNCDLAAISSLQNGAPDAISLEFNGVQVDGLSYEGDNANVAAIVEGTGTSAADNNTDEALGLSRLPDGNDTNNNDADFSLRCITPGEANISSNTDCLSCVITDISVSNLSVCDDNGTADPSDDFFTADVTVTFSDRPNTGNLNLSGDGTASVSATGLVSPHTFTGVTMNADGSNISLTATFSSLQSCTLNNNNAGTAPAACSMAPPCEVTDISVSNISACNDNGTPDPNDDTFTADVSVTFANAPATGTLDLSGDGTASVSVSGLTSPHTFIGVVMSADGTAISLTVSFSDDGACNLTNNNAGTAPAACSVAPPCEVTDISVNNISACNDNGTSDPNDDTFTADVSVTFANAPATGTFDLSGDGTAFISVVGLTSPHTFTGVVMTADGTAISLTASFSDDGACNLTNNNAGTAPMACSVAACHPVINEVDYNQPGSPDEAEFIELYNPCSDPINLDAYTLNLVNGANGSVYGSIDLPNVDLMAGDYYVICLNAATTSNCDLEGFSSLQNGDPDGISLIFEGNQVDGLSYGGDTPGVTEGTGTTAKDDNATEALGLSRLPDGNDTDNNDADFSLHCITPGEANVAAVADCLNCLISAITVGNISACNDNGTPDPSDDTFTADVTVTFSERPHTGNLNLSGDGMASVSVVGLSSPHTFLGVEMSADGTAISLTATFSGLPTCTLTNNNAGTAPAACSVAVCEISGISLSNISSCNSQNTADPNDDTFTADVTVNFTIPPGTGTLDLSGDGMASVSVSGLGTSHTFTGVVMAADGTAISLTAAFSDDGACTLTDSDLGTAPADCSDCSISSISVGNVSGCDSQGTIDPLDDTFTADVTVVFANLPATGTLDLTGDGSASVSVVGLTSPHTFTGVTMSADGMAISLTAAFSDDGACTFSNNNVAIAPPVCSNTVCDVSNISLSNISACNSQNTADPSDDTFTADVTVNFNAPPATGTLDLTGDGSASVSTTGLGTSHTFMGVVMAADGTAISLTAAFSADGACALTDNNVGTAPADCSDCSISSISVGNVSGCDSQGTIDPLDDTFTADVTVVFANLPATGTLDLTGDGSASVSVVGLTSPHTFTGVTMSADGMAISLTAAFSADGACTLTNNNVATAPPSCSNTVCDVSNISLSNISACNSQNTADPNDDTFTADVTVNFNAPPATGTLDLTGDGTASVAVAGLSTSHIFTGVVMSADGMVISLTAAFSADGACALTNNNVGTAPAACSACSITSISTANISACNGQGTGDPADDTFTADVTVVFADLPATGTLDLTGDGTASVSVVGLTSPHTFTGVTMSADGTAISLIASFSAEPTCSFTENSAGTAPASCSGCSINSIVLSNISSCNDNGTVDPNDDTFTANVTVNYVNPPSPGTIVLSGDASTSVSVGSGSSSHTLGGVVLSADGGDISLTAAFQEEPSCTFTDNNFGTAPASCSPCEISNIEVTNISACDDNGTPLPGDDTFTADVVVSFTNPPASGTLELSGDGLGSVAVAGLGSSYVFQNVQMSADGMAISLAASFSGDAACTFTNNNAGTAPEPCSCSPIINEVDYSQPGTDNLEFIEIFNPCSQAIDLSAYSLQLVNGSNGSTYQTIGLPNTMLAAGEYFVMCSSNNPSAYCDFAVISTIQNGAPDAVSLIFGGLQVDGLSYEGDVAGVVEGTGAGEDPDNVEAVGLSRYPNGTDTNDNSLDFSLRCITPGAANDNASASGCLNCGITAITVSNISACQGYGTGDPGDDTFTADVTVVFADRPNTGSLNLTVDGTASISANGLSSPHTFTGVVMSADGGAISLTATFSALQTCTFTNSNAGTAPDDCSDCNINNITLSNISSCNDNGTPDPADDYFTANVTVDYINPPSPGTIVLSGDASASVSVGSGSSSHTLGAVVFPADGGTISLTAAFQEEPTCSLTKNDLGTASNSCSACSIYDIALSDISSCQDNGTADPADDYFTADVTVSFFSPPSTGMLSLSGDGSASVAAAGLSGSYTFQDVQMSADGMAIGLTAHFTDDPNCIFINNNAGTAPASCSPCGIESIVLSNISACDNNFTTDPNDDTFTADVTVTYFQPPVSGTLDLSGDATASSASFGGNAHVFSGVVFSADGMDIQLTASFSANPTCSLTEVVGTAQGNCSGACFIVITDVIIGNESCPGAGDGSLTILVNSSVGQLGYSIDGGVSFSLFNTFNNLSPGTYAIMVKVLGQADCYDTTTSTVEPAPASALQTWYKDIDNDLYSDGSTIVSCNQPTGYQLAAALLALSGDCNDYDTQQFPGQTWYKDADNDGYSDGTTLVQCAQPTGYQSAQNLTALDGDCNDNNVAVHPGATEICDGIDNNCNASVDEGLTGFTYTGNVAFNTQAQLDAWPPCYSVIVGSVTITGGNITDLSPLSNIVAITGNVTIYFNAALTTLNGLENIVSVGGAFYMYYNFQLSDCCAIDDLLTNNGISGPTVIFYNAGGSHCGSEVAIENACPLTPLVAQPNSGFMTANSTDAIERENSLSLYPNPANEEVTIKFDRIEGSAEIRIFDLLGRVVFEKQLAEGDTQIKVGLSSGLFENGLYLVSLSENGEMCTKQLVIQN